MLYTLAGLSNPETGWGLAGESFRVLEMLNRYGADTWFNLGDLDLATHIRRTQMLGEGATLSQVTAELCRRLGVQHRITPMSDDPVRTFIKTDQGDLAMQDYFVRLRCEPRAASVSCVGAEDARPSEGFRRALGRGRPGGSMSIQSAAQHRPHTGPALDKRGTGKKKVRKDQGCGQPHNWGSGSTRARAKMMTELGHEATCLGVAKMYRDICDIFVIDEQDTEEAPAIASLGIRPVAAPTIMNTEEDKVVLARLILEMGGGFQDDE